MVKASGLLIERVDSGSLAEELGLEAGDRLLAINDQPLRDIIDYHYFAADDELVFLVEKAAGEAWEIEFDYDPDEPLGLTFATPVPASCGNSCVFCFVHQLPKGLRQPLYVKDEDYRLSFLYGNYVTLTNILPEEIARIREQRLSPLYISVHATDAAVREQLLGRRGLIPILDVLQELAAARITMHTQIVLCPGINDGAILSRTVSDLAALHPWVASLAIVPVGLTRYRNGLPRLEAVTVDYAARFISEWQPRSADLAKKLGEPFLFLADEFYLKGGVSFPSLDSYGDLPQIENGVGMIPLFLAEAEDVLAEAEQLAAGRVTVVTGQSPFPYLADFLGRLTAVTAVEVIPVAVPSLLFGEQVTVTGLVSGRDIIKVLDGVEIGACLLVPDVMLKEGDGLFLDDLTVDDLAAALGCRIRTFAATPHGIYDAIRDLFS